MLNADKDQSILDPHGLLSHSISLISLQDGVLKQGKHVLPQAKRVLESLSSEKNRLGRPVPFLLMTNGGGVTEAERLTALSKDFDIELGDKQLVQSHTPLQDYVADYRDQPVLVVGGRGNAGRTVAESYGLKQAYILQDLVAWQPSIWDRYKLTASEEQYIRRADFSQISFRAIFVIHDNGLDWGLATQIITELLTSRNGQLGTERSSDAIGDSTIPLIFTNPDIIWSTDYPLPRLGMGAFRIALEAVYKDKTGEALPYRQFGKPHAATYAFAEKMLRRHLTSLGDNPQAPLSVSVQLSRTARFELTVCVRYMVGDNPESDIAGANAHGWLSALVRTGVFRGGEPKHKPTIIVEDVERAVDWAIARELSIKA